MRALITGADGFVGRHLVRVLHREGWDVVPVTRALHGDIGDGLPDTACDVVFSLAATADPRVALADPAGAYVNGVRIMVATLDYAKRYGARVVHVTSNEAWEPRGPYAGGKRCQEVVCDSHAEVPVIVVVAQSLFGEGQQPDKFVPTIVRKLLAGEKIPVQGNGKDWATRPWLYVGNLCAALGQIDGGWDRVNVGARYPVSNEWVVQTVAGELGIEPLIERVPAGGRAGHELHVRTVGCDLRSEYPFGLAQSLQQTARWFAERS